MYKTKQISIEFEKKEKREAHILKKNKLVIPFTVESFNLKYGLTRYDLNTGILTIPYTIETKRSDDGIEEKFFKKYYDIIIAETLTDEQLTRKRKMQLELSQEFSLQNKNGILNLMLKKRILFPIVFRRYWMKLTQEHYDMKWLQADNTFGVDNPQTVLRKQLEAVPTVVPNPVLMVEPQQKPDLINKTPVLQIEGLLHISLPHFFRDLVRFNFAHILHQGELVKANALNREYFINFDYRLPNLFVRFNLEKVKEETIRFMKMELEGLERHKHFLNYNLKNIFGKSFSEATIEWANDRQIKLIFPETKFKRAMDIIRKKAKPVVATLVLIDALNKKRKKKKKKK